MAILQRQKNPGPLAEAPMRHGLPAAYNETYLRLLLRDPRQFFAFWEFSSEAFATALNSAVKDGSGFRPVLRLFMVDSAPHDRGLEVADFLLEEGEDSRYIPVPQQGRPYRLECGFATLSGRFIAICSSNEVRTPDAMIHPEGATPESAAEQREVTAFDGNPDAVPGLFASSGNGRPRIHSLVCPSDERFRFMGGSEQCFPSPASGGLAVRSVRPIW